MSTGEILKVAGDRVASGQRVRGAVHWNEERVYREVEGLGDAVAEAFPADPPRRKRAVEVWLERSVVQLRTLDGLPNLAERDLRGLVEHQRDRFFRPTRGAVVMSAHWTDTSEGESLARAALVEADLLTALERGLEAVSRFPRAVAVEGDREDESPLEFETPAMASRRAAALRRRITAGTLLALLGWAVAAGIYLADLLRDEHALAAEWEALQAPLSRLDQVEARLERFQPLVEAARRQGADDHWLVPRLLEVASALPRSVHILALAAERDGPMSIEAHGPDAVAAVQALSVMSFGASRLQAQPTEEADDGAPVQRFVISVEPRS
jgi:hypothetical protein